MTTSSSPGRRVVLLGTYDLGKPRTRLMRQAMRQIDPDLQELHFAVWDGVEDKSVSGLGARLAVVLRLLLAYPVLAVRYLLAAKHDVVVIGYMGLFDMLLLAPLAKLRRKPVVWDVFLSIYDTYARDRRMAAQGSWKAGAIRWLERTACRIADQLVLDTQAHAALVGELHDVPSEKLAAVLVGAEEGNFAPPGHAVKNGDRTRIEVLFYGQFIPLHGIDTIIDAALDPRGTAHDWKIIGTGQEAARIDRRLSGGDYSHIKRIEWVDYAGLGQHLAEADICLGIFGTSEKAARVIPNKVYQTMLAGKPLITRDSPAIRELVTREDAGIYLVSPADPSSLLDALDAFATERADLPPSLHSELTRKFALPRLVADWRAILERAL